MNMSAYKIGTDISVRIATSDDAGEWDRFVFNHPDGTMFHRFGWMQAVQETYGYRPLPLLTCDGNEIIGVAPLIDAKTPLLGRSLISTGFTVGGGPLALDEIALHAVAEEAEKLALDAGAKYVEFRSAASPGAGWIEKKDVYASFQITLPSTPETALTSIPRKRRAEIRKALSSAEKGDLHICHRQNFDLFYDLYSISLRNHGTPVFPRAFLTALMNHFGDDVDISVAEYRGRPVAALLSFFYKDVAYPYYIGALPVARDMRAAEFLYWSLMVKSIERGCKSFDFGRSRIGTGPYHFKKLWGVEPAPLIYQHRLITLKSLPNVNPQNPKFAQFVKIWRRLPLGVTNRLGPLLSANFP
ncbi:MAG: FemAB family XrtA/PEP-CTERM system-associated protein [Pseudomonadota bacterium]